MSYSLINISNLIEKVDKWNPKKVIPNEVFSYIDLSSIDKEKKVIDDKLVNILKGSKAPSRAKQLLKRNDILISTVRPNLNSVAIVDKDYSNTTASTGYCVLRPTNKVNHKYLFYWTLTNQFISDMVRQATGASYPAISDNTVKDSKIPLPPLKTQKKIAAILDEADKLRQLDKKLIKKYEDLTQSLFLDMFGDPVTNPKGWDKIALGKLSDRIVVGHVGPTSNGYASKGIPFLRTQNVRKNFINYKDILFVKHEFHDRLNKSKIYARDILISRVGVNRGMAAVVPEDLNEANCANVVIVGSSSKFNSLYISFFLNRSFGTKPEYGYSVGSAQGVVNTSIVKRWPVFKVPKTLENQFAERVQIIEAQKVLAQQSLQQAENLFNSLLQEAYKGELV